MAIQHSICSNFVEVSIKEDEKKNAFVHMYGAEVIHTWLMVFDIVY